MIFDQNAFEVALAMARGSPGWNRCDACGRFIAYADFEMGATRTHRDADWKSEEYETLCIKCAKRETTP